MPIGLAAGPAPLKHIFQHFSHKCKTNCVLYNESTALKEIERVLKKLLVFRFHGTLLRDIIIISLNNTDVRYICLFMYCFLISSTVTKGYLGILALGIITNFLFKHFQCTYLIIDHIVFVRGQD